jgi:hypothetical protein
MKRFPTPAVNIVMQQKWDSISEFLLTHTELGHPKVLLFEVNEVICAFYGDGYYHKFVPHLADITAFFCLQILTRRNASSRSDSCDDPQSFNVVRKDAEILLISSTEIDKLLY